MSSDPAHERFGTRFPAGAVLFREGDPAGEMYVIHSGRVQLSRKLRGVDTIIAILPQGEFFGELAVVNSRPRSATATVIEEAVLLVIEPKAFEQMVRRNAEIAVRMIRKLAVRLDQLNQQVEVLLLQDNNHRVVRALRRLAERSGEPQGEGVRIAIALDELARYVGLTAGEVAEILDRLGRARLVAVAADGKSITLAEVGRLDDFLQFLEMKERLALQG